LQKPNDSLSLHRFTTETHIIIKQQKKIKKFLYIKIHSFLLSSSDSYRKVRASDC